MNAHESNGNYIINFIKSNPYNPKAAQKLARHLDMLKADQQIFLRDTYNKNFSYYTKEQLERALKTACEQYQGIDWPSVEDIKKVLQRPQAQAVSQFRNGYAHIKDPLYLEAIHSLKLAHAQRVAAFKNILLELNIDARQACRLLWVKNFALISSATYKVWHDLQDEIMQNILPVIAHFEKRNFSEILSSYAH